MCNWSGRRGQQEWKRNGGEISKLMGEKKSSHGCRTLNRLNQKKNGFYFQPDLPNNKKQVKNQTQYIKEQF